MSNPVSRPIGHFSTLLIPYSLLCRTLFFVMCLVLLLKPLALHSRNYSMDS